MVRAAYPRVAPAPLWFGAFGGPVAYAVHLLLSWLLVPVACALGTNLPLHLLSLVTGLVAAAATVVAYRSWRRLRGHEADPAEPRVRPAFMGLFGVYLGALSLAIIGYAELANYFLDPCLPPPARP